MSGVLTALLTGSVVDTKALLDTAIASVVAGLGVTLAASTAIYGFAAAAEMRRNDRVAASVGPLVLGIVALLIFAAAIAAGIAVMLGG
jgi:hypothetical protein